MIDIDIYADWMYHLFLEIDDISEFSVWTKLRLTSQMIKKYLDLIMNQIIYSSDKIFLMKIWIQVLFEFTSKQSIPPQVISFVLVALHYSEEYAFGGSLNCVCKCMQCGGSQCKVDSSKNVDSRGHELQR